MFRSAKWHRTVLCSLLLPAIAGGWPAFSRVNNGVASSSQRLECAADIIIDPICSTSPSEVAGGQQSVVFTAEISSAQTSDVTYTVACTNQSALNAPGGWPYSLTIPAGSLSASVTLTSNSVGANTAVTTYCYQPGDSDPSDLANWLGSASVTVAAQAP